MIASLRGTVLGVTGTTLILDVGGVGYQVAVTPSHALGLRPGDDTVVRTALIVREDEMALFGFADEDSRSLFDLLRGVSGVGPKSAMAVLGALSPQEIADAVNRENDAAFRAVPGVGPKTAKLIIVSLAGKLHVSSSKSTPRTAQSRTIADNVLVALVGLGWSERVAAQAVDDALSEATDDERSSVPLVLRSALARLGPAGTQGSR